MKRVKLVISAFALMAASIFGAQAADDLVIPAVQEDAYTPVEVGSGWYIRGDLGYDLSSNASGTYRTFGDLDPTAGVALGYSTVGYDRFNFDAARNSSIGVGYQLNAFVRGDITAGLWKRNVNGTDLDPGFTDATTGDLFICNLNTNPTYPTAVACRSKDTTSVKAIEVMANAYADLGTYHGFTPYLGAGVGMTRLKFSNLTNISRCIDAAGLEIAGCLATTGIHPGRVSTRLTFALMAGTSYDLTKNLKLDVGYRYSRIQGGDMFGFDAATAGTGATGVQGKDKGFSSHQLKAGLRYEIW